MTHVLAAAERNINAVTAHKNVNMHCAFCDNQDIKQRLVYRDNFVIAFPTNTPIVPGHILVCPVRHIQKIDQLSDEEWKAIKNFIVKLTASLRITLGAEGFNIAWNDGEIAGQSVPHLHLHVVPRKSRDTGVYEYDPRKFLYRPGTRAASPEEELKAIAQLIRDHLV